MPTLSVLTAPLSLGTKPPPSLDRFREAGGEWKNPSPKELMNVGDETGEIVIALEGEGWRRCGQMRVTRGIEDGKQWKAASSSHSLSSLSLGGGWSCRFSQIEQSIYFEQVEVTGFQNK